MQSILKALRKSDKSIECNFRTVPCSCDELTFDWFNETLKKESILSPDVCVSAIDVTQLRNEVTGSLDGGGLSGSALVRVNLKYGPFGRAGNVTGKEPSSLICKLSLGNEYNVTFFWRTILYLSSGGGYDEYMYMQEAKFVKHVLPVMDNTLYVFPKIYFCGVDDQGDRGFGTAVIFSRPTKVKTITLMEDMKHWKPCSVGIYVSKETAKLCFKNVAVLHAKFWGDKLDDIKSLFKPSKVDKDFRPGAYSKTQAILRKFYFSTNKIHKNIDKLLESDWKTVSMTTLKQDSLFPDWFTAQPLRDGTRPVFGDDLVLEMLRVLGVKAPNYYRKKLKSFIQKPPQTMLHGDFHAGNHMYGIDENVGKIVALDFQFAGPGLVVTEFVYFFMMSLSPHSLEDLMEIARAYHTELVVNGVHDYGLEEFIDDIKMLVTDFCIAFLSMCTIISPASIKQYAKGMWKDEGASKIFDNCIYGKLFLLLTAFYLKDKDSFMN